MEEKDAIYYLIKHNVLNDRNIEKKFPLNLSRDCNIQSTKDIISAMNEFAIANLRDSFEAGEMFFKSGGDDMESPNFETWLSSKFSK